MSFLLKNIMKLLTCLCILFVYFATPSLAQQDSTYNKKKQEDVLVDSLKKKIDKFLDISFEEKFLLFNAGLKQDSTHRSLVISGYVDAYYGYYTDSVGNNNFQKFPTIAPRSNTFGINLAQLSARYSSEKLRGILTLHYGDIPASAWSGTYNFLQEANMGIKLFKKVWFDIGFFRTHLGCESIQPRENINIGVALTTYYDPYFLSGAKLSYQATPKLLLQLNAFNGYNTFVQINNKKTYGITAIYEPTAKLLLSYNFLFSDENPDEMKRRQLRAYHDFFAIYKTQKLDMAFEANFGLQTNSQLADTTKTAFMGSATVIGKYKFTSKKAIFARCEVFDDPNDMLTGPVFNTTHQLVGLQAAAFSIGAEFKPTENSYLRIEHRYLQTTNGAKIFRYENTSNTQRLEWLFATGFWF